MYTIIIKYKGRRTTVNQSTMQNINQIIKINQKINSFKLTGSTTRTKGFKPINSYSPNQAKINLPILINQDSPQYVINHRLTEINH